MLLLSLGPETLAALLRAGPPYATSSRESGLPDLSWLLFRPGTPLPATAPPENPETIQAAE